MSRDLSTHRLALVGDQLLTREALCAAIGSHGVPVLEHAIPRDGAELHEWTQLNRAFDADVGMFVIERFDPFVIGACARLVRRVPRVHWVVLTACAPGPFWGALLDGGAEAVLPLDIDLEGLLAALPDMARGAPVMDPVHQARSQWRDVEERAMLERLASLSPGEYRVLVEMARGRSVAQLAERHGVSAETVRSQVKAILRKLKVTSQLAAVAEWGRARRDWPSSDGFCPPVAMPSPI